MQLIVVQNTRGGTYVLNSFFLNFLGINYLPYHIFPAGSHQRRAVELRNASTTDAMSSQMTRRSDAESRRMLTT